MLESKLSVSGRATLIFLVAVALFGCFCLSPVKLFKHTIIPTFVFWQAGT